MSKMMVLGEFGERTRKEERVTESKKGEIHKRECTKREGKDKH